MDRRTVRTNRANKMQRPIDSLRQDHRLTCRAVRVLAAIAGAVRDGQAFPAADCAAVLRFLREWVIPVHMQKEDAVLAPAAAMRGDERTAATVGELMLLGEEIFELTHALVVFWEPLEELTDAERHGFVEAVEALVARLERRYRLEEDVLFPACDATVPADDQLDWYAQFAACDAGRSDRSAWEPGIDALARTWLD